jgi:hypothetical protein
MKKLLVIWNVLAIPLMFSCSQEMNPKEITSGRIDYKITYLNNNLDSKTLEILPKHMKLIFDEKHAINNIEGFLGFYKLEAITNFHTRKCSTMLKIFDKNYLFRGKRDEMMCCFDSMDDMKIKETSETKNIAGFVCKKDVIYLPSAQTSFEVYYTSDFGLKHPNSTNPYHEINGVLMEFELNLLYLRMRITAEKFQPAAEASGETEFPANSKTISRDQMTEILSKLMEK